MSTTGVKRNKEPKKLVSVRVSNPEVHAVVSVVCEDVEEQSELYDYHENNVLTDGGLETIDLSWEIYKVVNRPYDDPQNHKYKAFADDSGVYHCICPVFEYNAGACKHMEAVDGVNRSDTV